MHSIRVVALKVSIAGALMLSAGGLLAANASTDTITVADASLAAAFYADSSCLLTIDSLAQSGKTVIDADVDDVGSRMLIHCDTVNGRRLTLLARGDSLNISQRVPLLNREQISEGSFGMIAWLTRSGVHYADDSAPRRYVIAGNVKLRRSPPVDIAGNALHTQRQAFARVSGVLEPALKQDSKSVMETIAVEPPVAGDTASDQPSEENAESVNSDQEADQAEESVQDSAEEPALQ